MTIFSKGSVSSCLRRHYQVVFLLDGVILILIHQRLDFLSFNFNISMINAEMNSERNFHTISFYFYVKINILFHIIIMV